LKTFLLIVAVFVALCAAVLGYAGYANYAAERSARSFCDATAPGSTLDAALARAGQRGARHLGPMKNDGREVHDFQFQGWVFNVGVCRAVVADGRIVSVAAMLEGD
jgi:hypothetical protein